MEPERPIEKLLRGFAKKRLDDAGPPMELHPATRHLLQGEVARGRPRQTRGGAFSLVTTLLRPGIIASACVVLVLIGVATFLPVLNRAKTRAESVQALSNLRQIGIAARIYAGDNGGNLPDSLSRLRSQLAGTNTLADPVSGKQFVYLGGGRNLSGLDSNAILAYSPTDSKRRAVLLADGRAEQVGGEEFYRLANREPVQLASADKAAQGQAPGKAFARKESGGVGGGVPPAVAPASAAAPGESSPDKAPAQYQELAVNAPALKTEPSQPSGRPMNEAAASPPLQREAEQPAVTRALPVTAAFASVAGVTQQFAQVQSDLFSRKGGVAVGSLPVLQTFTVEQSGANLRVLDQDGSVYIGFAEPTNHAASSLDLAKGTASAGKDSLGGSNPGQAADSYSFRVSGTNLSLNQNVVFTGTLFAGAAANDRFQVTNTLPINGILAERSLSKAVQPSSPETRISGNAVIGNQSIPIRAVPSQQR